MTFAAQPNWQPKARPFDNSMGAILGYLHAPQFTPLWRDDDLTHAQQVVHWLAIRLDQYGMEDILSWTAQAVATVSYLSNRYGAELARAERYLEETRHQVLAPAAAVNQKRYLDAGVTKSKIPVSKGDTVQEANRNPEVREQLSAVMALREMTGMLSQLHRACEKRGREIEQHSNNVRAEHRDEGN